MDDRAFDRLAKTLGRRFGGPMSRRAAVAAGVAAAIGATRRNAAARPYSIPLGGACYHDRQCIPAEPGPSENIVYCADNGFGWDGEFNCCRYWGGRCWGDGDCCADLSCNAGYCSSRFDYAGPAR